MKQKLKKAWPWIAVVLVAMGLTYTNQLASHQAKQTAAQVKILASGNRALVKGIQNAITTACELNGNALREVIREEIRAGFTNPDDPRLKEILPDVPQPVIERIAKEENAKRERRLLKAHNVNCVAVYKRFSLP